MAKKKYEFRVHAHGRFAFDPLCYVDGSVGQTACFTNHSCNSIFTRALDHLMKELEGDKWALFYCKPNTSLENGLTLIHTDNDVRRFFHHPAASGSINLFIAHEQQPLSKYYLKNMVWQEEDAGQRCCSSSPFKRRMPTKRLVLRNSEVKFTMNVKGSDEGGSGAREEDAVTEGNKGKAKKKRKDTVIGSEARNESSRQVVKTYRREVIDGRAKMVEVPSD